MNLRIVAIAFLIIGGMITTFSVVDNFSKSPAIMSFDEFAEARRQRGFSVYAGLPSSYNEYEAVARRAQSSYRRCLFDLGYPGSVTYGAMKLCPGTSGLLTYFGLFILVLGTVFFLATGAKSRPPRES